MSACFKTGQASQAADHADRLLAPRHERVAAQEVCGRTVLAADQRRPAARGVVAGGTRHTGSAGRAKIPLEQSAVGTVGELASYAHRRYAVEQFNEEAKGELGRDQTRGGYGRAFTGMRSL